MPSHASFCMRTHSIRQLSFSVSFSLYLYLSPSPCIHGPIYLFHLHFIIFISTACTTILALSFIFIHLLATSYLHLVLIDTPYSIPI